MLARPALGKLNRLGLLADLYTEILLPAPVYHEVIVQGALLGCGMQLQNSVSGIAG
jgi:hypothetical protein